MIMKKFLQLILAILALCCVVGGVAVPAWAGTWELSHYERNGRYDNTDIAVSSYSYVYSEQHHNKTTVSWNGEKEVVTHNGVELTGSAAHLADSSVKLWWNNGRPQFQQPIKAGVAPAQSSGILSITPVFKWKRNRVGNYQDGYTEDRDDNPPDALYYTEVADIIGGEFIRQWDGNGTPEYSADKPFYGKHFTFSNVRHPFNNNSLIRTPALNGLSASYRLYGRQVVKLEVGGQDEVRGETRTFSGTIDINTAYGEEIAFDRHGSAGLSFSYIAAPQQFQLDVSAPSIQSRNNNPTERELDAYASKNWSGVDDPNSPIDLNWIGAASYTANLSSDLSTQLGNKEYRWTLSDNLSNDPLDSANVNASHFLNRGSKLNEGASSSAKVVIGGSNADSEILHASATIHWFQRPYTKYRAEVVTEVIDYNTGETTDLDSVMSGGNELTTEEERTLDEFTSDYDAMKTEFVSTGAQLVGSALEAEMMVGSWFVPDEVDLASVGVTLAGKPLKELYKVGKTLRATQEVAARINRVRDKLAGAVPAIAKKLGHSNFAIVMKRKKYRVSREGHVGPHGMRQPAPMGELKEEEEILCNIPGGACFVKGTLVSGEHGSVAIQNVKENDLVWSRDEASGKTELKRVQQTFERYAATLALTFSNGETIETTSEHPFYVVGRGFVKAGELGIGTSIVTRAGPSVALRVATAGKAQTVYNFEVADYHTYFVGQSALWVHNQCGIARLAPGSLSPQEEADLVSAIQHIDAGTTPPWLHPNANGTFGRPYQNRLTQNNDHLPGVPGAGGYTEFDVPPPPGVTNRGPRRVLRDNNTGDLYYTSTHYGDAGFPSYWRVR